MAKRRDRDLLRTIGQRVREIRVSRGLSQEALAAAAEMQSETVSRIETAAVSADLTTLARVSAALGVALADVIDPGRPIVVDGLGTEELDLLAAMRGLSPAQRTALLAFLRCSPS